MEDGLQPLEALLFTVQQLNNDSRLLPGVRLGVAAFDSCDNPAHAMEQALHFVKGEITYMRRESISRRTIAPTPLFVCVTLFHYLKLRLGHGQNSLCSSDAHHGPLKIAYPTSAPRTCCSCKV